MGFVGIALRWKELRLSQNDLQRARRSAVEKHSEDANPSFSMNHSVVVQFGFLCDPVILSVAVFQAQRRISRLTA